MKRIAKEWNDYQEKVLTPECSTVQVVETRRAFYAGAVSLWAILLRILEPGTEATKKDLEVMDEIAQEFAEWRRVLELEAKAVVMAVKGKL